MTKGNIRDFSLQRPLPTKATRSRQHSPSRIKRNERKLKSKPNSTVGNERQHNAMRKNNAEGENTPPKNSKSATPTNGQPQLSDYWNKHSEIKQEMEMIKDDWSFDEKEIEQYIDNQITAQDDQYNEADLLGMRINSRDSIKLLPISWC